MSLEPPKSQSLLAPIAESYKPTPADFERVKAKIDEARAQGAANRASSTQRAALQWIGLSCVAILAVGLTSRTLATRTADDAAPSAAFAESPDVVAVTPRTPTAPAAPAPSPLASTAVVPVVSIDALPRAPIAPPSTTAKPSAAARADDDSLLREAKLLAEAEAAFRRDDDARALAFLEAHAKEFPNGVLKDERTAERIVVLCHAGRVDEATREGRAFLRARGSDPLARRVALSCAGTAPEAGPR